MTPKNSQDQHETMRPITLHAIKLLTPQDLVKDLGVQQRVVSLHIELDMEVVKQLAMVLNERIEEGKGGGVRIGFKGHLVHG